MLYECDHCEAALTPGLIACPDCGQVFDEPVPDTQRESAVPAEAPEVAQAEHPLEMVMPAGPRASCSLRRCSLSEAAAVVLLLLGLGWIGVRYENTPAALVSGAEPAAAPMPAPRTEPAAHPQYRARMMAFVQVLRAMRVGAEWPIFGSNDILLVTPQRRGTESSAGWNADMYRRLAQGIYGQFAQNRREAGFADMDATACVVIVTSASGKVMAVDFMGNLQ